MKWQRWAVLIVVAVQLAVPAWMIFSRERILATGTAFRFRTAPVDPYDAFRGRYVALRFDQTQAAAPAGPELRRGQKTFAVLETDKDGFAHFKELRRERPASEPYLTVRVGYYSSGSIVNLELPFDRFYMEERTAPAAEQAYRQNSRRDSQNASVIVRIRGGRGVIENLLIGDVPIAEYVRNQKPGS